MVNTNIVSASKYLRDKIIRMNALTQHVTYTDTCIIELCEVRDGTMLCDFDYRNIKDRIHYLCCFVT